MFLSRTGEELEVAEMKVPRFSLGRTKIDGIRNEPVRGRARVWRLEEESDRDVMRDLHLMSYISAIFVKCWNEGYPMGWFALLWLMKKVLHTFTRMFSKAWHEHLSFGLQIKAPMESWSCLSERDRMFCRSVARLLELHLYEREWKQAERSLISPWRRPADRRLTFLDFPSNNRLLGLLEGEHRGHSVSVSYSVSSHSMENKLLCWNVSAVDGLRQHQFLFQVKSSFPSPPKHTFIYVLK